MTTKRFTVCPRCLGDGRERVKGRLSAILCPSCGGHGKVSARYFEKLIQAQRLARMALGK